MNHWSCTPARLLTARRLTIMFAGRIGYAMQTIHWRAHTAAISLIILTAALAADTRATVPEVDAGASSRMAAYLNNLASVYSSEARYAEAEQHYRKALGIWEQVPGQEASVALALNNLGVLLRRQARYAEAETVDLQALQMFEKFAGP